MPDSLDRFEPRFWPRDDYLAQAALAYDIAAQCSPEFIAAVELGDEGVYFSACQCLQQIGKEPLAYCYGSWTDGGIRGQASSEQRDTHNRRFYRGFSYLLDRPIGETHLQHFEPGTVDFLLLGKNVDGTYADWLERLTPNGIALIEGATETPADRRGYTLSLPESVTLCFAPGIGPSECPVLDALEEDGVEAVSAFYRYIGEHLRLLGVIGNRLGEG